MLKVTSLFIAAAAALGMSSLVSAQSTPPPSYTTAQAAALWGYMSNSWTRTTNGNTNTFSHTPTPSSVPPSSATSQYTTIKKMGDGFTLEQKGYSPVPGRDLAHPVLLRKPITHASMAKAFAKTLPIVGNAMAMKELLDALFDTNVTYNTSNGTWDQPSPGYTEWWYVANYGSHRATSAYAACTWAAGQVFGGPHTVNLTLRNGTEGQLYQQMNCGFSGIYVIHDRYRCTASGSTYTAKPTTAQCPDTQTPITETKLQDKLGSLFSFPPEAEELLPYLPEPARKDLAQENTGPGVSVIPYTPDGQPSFEPWVSPESISTTSTQASSEIKTTTKRTTVTGTPVQDGIKYETKTETTTETQKLDPVTGLPETDPVTGEPVKETTTTTETTEQTPNKPQEGEDLECGLPGTPPCKIDETGTPAEAPESIEKAADDYKTSMDELRDIVKSSDDKGMFESLRGVFLVPPIAACSPFDLPNDMGSIDPCPVVDGVREVMAYIWALTALWWCLGMIREVI